MVVRRITAGERRRAEEIFSIAFETPWQEETYPTEKYAAFLEDDETMTSCLSILPFSVCFDGETVKMAGIGGVSSLPQYRRTGGIRGCFEKMLPDLYQEGYVLSMLYPFSTNYYRKFGYEVWARGARYEMDLSYIPKLSREGGFMLADSSNRDRALEDIRLLTKEWEGRYNGMVKLTEREYAFVTEAVYEAMRPLKKTYSVDSTMEELLANPRIVEFLSPLMEVEIIPDMAYDLSLRQTAETFGGTVDEEQMKAVDMALAQF